MKTQADIAIYQKELDRLNAIVERGRGATVRAIHDVYPGTSVTIDQSSLMVKDQQKSIEFVKRKGSVIMLALDDVLV